MLAMSVCQAIFAIGLFVVPIITYSSSTLGKLAWHLVTKILPAGSRNNVDFSYFIKTTCQGRNLNNLLKVGANNYSPLTIIF